MTSSLDWHLLKYPPHAGLKRWVEDLNRFYRSQPALYQLDFTPSGFEWVDCNDIEQSVVSLIRKGRGNRDVVLVVANFTPVPRLDYCIGVPRMGFWSATNGHELEQQEDVI